MSNSSPFKRLMRECGFSREVRDTLHGLIMAENLPGLSADEIALRLFRWRDHRVREVSVKIREQLRKQMCIADDRDPQTGDRKPPKLAGERQRQVDRVGLPDAGGRDPYEGDDPDQQHLFH